MRLGAKLMIDSSSNETNREKRGRLLTLSVVVQSRAAEDVAICPRINFAAKGTPDIQLQEYTDNPSAQCTQAGVTPGPAGFVAQCVGSKASADMLPIHVAREQWYDPQCNRSGPLSIVGPGDTVTLGSGTSCAAETQVLDFQLSLEDVDRQLGGTFLNDKSADDLLMNTSSGVIATTIDLFVFDNLPRGIPFHCPSGVNVEFQSWASSANVRVRQYTLKNKALGPSGSQAFETEVRR